VAFNSFPLPRHTLFKLRCSVPISTGTPATRARITITTLPDQGSGTPAKTQPPGRRPAVLPRREDLMVVEAAARPWSLGEELQRGPA